MAVRADLREGDIASLNLLSGGPMQKVGEGAPTGGAGSHLQARRREIYITWSISRLLLLFPAGKQKGINISVLGPREVLFPDGHHVPIHPQ